MVALYKAPFPLWTGIWEAYALPFASNPFVGKAPARWLVESGRGLRHARPSPLSILSGPGHFRRNNHWRNLVFFARLRLSSVEWPAGCWRSQPYGWSWSSCLSVVEIPGMIAGRLRCPWHTPEVIPPTLAPETGEVSWVSMGLWRVLFLAEVRTLPSKSQDSSSGSEVIALEVKSRGALPAILGRAGSEAEPAPGCPTAASRCPVPRNLDRFGF
jgi:hypothetical protein